MAIPHTEENESFFFMNEGDQPPLIEMPVRIRLARDESERCMDFAREKIKTTKYYGLRGQVPNLKQEYDGQAGNLALNKYLKIPTDFKVYQMQHKSFAADAGIHDCKTCSRESVKNYNGGRPSWVFGIGDAAGSNKSVDPVHRSTYFVVEVGKYLYEIRWLLRPEQIKSIWTPPDKKELTGFKRVVREQHIPPGCRIVIIKL